MAMSIELLDLSVYTYNILRRAGIKTIGDIMAKTPGELKNIRRIGPHSLKEIISKMESINTGYLAKYGKTIDDMDSIVKGKK
jgi:DNA-directed RNA polymerase subunit alpha